jgi:hypothetical protein
MRVEYHPAVEGELREIRAYYDERSPGLGAAFIDEFERQILQVAATPERWTSARQPARREHAARQSELALDTADDEDGLPR